MENVFEINKFNIISDDENYYLFRALNMADISDIKQEITTNENIINRIRTDRERWEELKEEKAKYSIDSQISLEEMFDHTKRYYSKETNCISLSNNTNVSLIYGQVHVDKYVMIKVPRKDTKDIYNAGKYMLEQVEKEINKVMSELPKDSDILNIIDSINKTNEHKQIQDDMKNVYKKARTGGVYTGEKRTVDKKISITDRLSKKQYFSEEQQVEYDKIIAKLTVLETYGELKNIIPNTKDNASLIQTIGSAFSSGELIHYKDIPKDKINMISKNLMEIFALVQQAKDNDRDNKQIKEIEERILDLANNGYDLIEKNGRLIFSNGSQEIDIKEANNDIVLKEDDYNISNELNIENIYNLTKGIMSYEKAKKAIESSFYLSKSKEKTYELVDILRNLTGNKEEYKEIFDKIENDGFTIDSNIVKRQNNKGRKLCESVNLDMNEEGKDLLTYEEQEKLISMIENLDKEGIQEIIKSGGMNVQKEIFDNILGKTEEKSENRYFAEAIIDTVEMSKSHKLKKKDRQKIIERIEEGNAKRLYQAIEKTGVEKEKIPAIFLNIVSMNALKGFEYSKLSEDEYLDEIIKKDKDNFRDTISVTDFDILKGKKIDDRYIIPGTNIELRDYQNKAFQRINKIYETHRYASVVLPTGAGKSFVAMAQMLETRKNKQSNIVYFAPNTTILHQLKNHIIKHILKDDYKKYKTEKEKDEAIQKGLKEIGLDINLKLKCYQSLTQKDEEELEKFNADLIVLDEAHRTGAEKWFKKIKTLIEKNKDAKVLGITATPIRDKDEKDMTEEIARITGYTEEEIQEEKYMAYKMELIEAMQDEIVVTPNVVTTILKPSLDKDENNNYIYETEGKEQLEQIRKAIEIEQDEQRKKELQEIYNNMQDIIKNAKGIPDLLKEHMKKQDGRYIVFIPAVSKDGNDEKITDERVIEFFKNYQTLVKSWFNEAGIKLDDDEMYFMSSHRNNKENDEALQKFEASESDSAKLMFVYGKLDEGVHVDGINGIMWLRKIDRESRNKYLQQLGRCIYGLDSENPPSEEEIPVVFDLMNNTLRQNMDKQVNSYTPKNDLEKLSEIVEWINEHEGYMPDINCENKIEVRKAINLKRIQQKYSKYLNSEKIDDKEIRAILELGKEIELWNIELEDKVDKEEKVIPISKLVKIQNFEITGEIKSYLDLVDKGREIVNKKEVLNDEERLERLLEVLDIIKDKGIITLGDEGSIKNIIKKHAKYRELTTTIQDVKDKLSSSEYEINMGYKVDEEMTWAKEYVKNNLERFDLDKRIQYDDFELLPKEFDKDGYNIYTGFNKENWSIDDINKNTRTKFDEKHWSRRGINEITNDIYDKDGYDKDGYNNKDWNKNGINKFTKSIYDKDGYSESGYNKDGYDKDGYNWIGWNEEGINKFTNDIYDEWGYSKDGYNRDGYNRYGYDKNGYNKEGYNKYGYDKNGYNKDGYDKDGYNKDGYNRKGWNEEGINKSTKGIYDKDGYNKDGYNRDGYDKYGYDKEGYNKKGWNRKKINKFTNDIYDEEGYDKAGYNKDGYNKAGWNLEGINKFTENMYDINNFDKYGNFWRLDGNGNLVTNGKLNNDGFYANGKHKSGYDYNPETGKKIDGTEIIDDKGFNICTKKYKGTDYYYNSEGYNAHGINRDGICKDTNEKHQSIMIVEEYIGSGKNIRTYCTEKISSENSKMSAKERNVKIGLAIKELNECIEETRKICPGFIERIESKIKQDKEETIDESIHSLFANLNGKSKTKEKNGYTNKQKYNQLRNEIEQGKKEFESMKKSGKCTREELIKKRDEVNEKIKETKELRSKILEEKEKEKQNAMNENKEAKEKNIKTENLRNQYSKELEKKEGRANDGT